MSLSLQSHLTTTEAKVAKNAARQARRRAKRAAAKDTAYCLLWHNHTDPANCPDSLIVPAAFPNICPPHNHFDNSTTCPDCQHYNNQAELLDRIQLSSDAQEIVELALEANLIDEADANTYSNFSVPALQALFS